MRRACSWWKIWATTSARSTFGGWGLSIPSCGLSTLTSLPPCSRPQVSLPGAPTPASPLPLLPALPTPGQTRLSRGMGSIDRDLLGNSRQVPGSLWLPKTFSVLNGGNSTLLVYHVGCSRRCQRVLGQAWCPWSL